MAKKNDEVNIWEKVHKADGCWEWLGCIDRARTAGYGVVTWNGRSCRAHRVIYELVRGPIPHGLTLDHICRNRACVNPAHLEPVTNRTNILRGAGLTAVNARKTHCKRGHALTGGNLVIMWAGTRWCRECRMAWDRNKRAARKAEALKHEGGA